MLTLLTILLICIVLTMVFLFLADEKSLAKVPFFHRTRSIVSVFTRWAFRSDIIVSTIRYIRKLKSLAISNICRLAE